MRLRVARALAVMAAWCGLAGWMPAWAQSAPAPPASQPASQPANPAPNIALYYGARIPWDELAAFDIAVVEPDHVSLPFKPGTVPSAGRGLLGQRTELLAYLSVGEINPSRAYFRDLPEAWRAGRNTAWGSVVIDQSQPDWPAWFMDKAVRPLWRAGYRGFFLDTLDSFNLFAKTDAERAAQAEGLARVITAIKREFPQAKLIFNRGFEVLPRVHDLAYAVAAESLFQGWDAAAQRYREVPQADRDWLLAQLNRVRNEYRLPVLAVDYVPPEKRELARATAQRITQLGFVPWVSNPALDALGVGAIEVMPRKVLVVYDGSTTDYALTFEEAFRFLAMPLNYLGYTVEFREVRQPAPDYPLAGRYAGMAVMFSSDEPQPSFEPLLEAALAQGLKVAFVGDFGLAGEALSRLLGLRAGEPTGPSDQLSIALQDRLIGFEAQPLPDRRGFRPLAAEGGTPLLKLRNERGENMDAAAFMPWGGYVLRPYSIALLPANKGQRWVVQPIEFLRRALALPDMPVPDVTTESGRRLMMMHVDGDGFASRAELPGTPYSGEVLQKDILEKYRIPATVSVIEGETGRDGLYASQSPALEAVARKIFALPWVEIASHSFSHPFRWSKAEESAAGEATETYTLPIPNYRFDLTREVNGSVDYINKRLAPPGKKVKMFLWTGDCNPDDDAIEKAYEDNLLNLNGGETWITRAEPSLTLVAPVGIKKGDYWQIYGPNQNENVYTNLWTGPFYGFERVIETFQMTERPWRLKPIDVYFHMYSATKRASLTALHKALDWALAQRVMNVYASEYAAKAVDFMHMVVARPVGRSASDSVGQWRVRGAGDLRTLRMSAAQPAPDFARSSGLAGYRQDDNNGTDAGGQRYLHLSGGEAVVALMAPGAGTRDGVPFLTEANARVASASRDADGLALELAGHLPITFTLANAAACRVSADGKPLTGRTAGTETSYALAQDGTAKITVQCRR